jgi:NAD(P)-dependent dehydrogenase (short-subunit alcohol dehydrogenase family)
MKNIFITGASRGIGFEIAKQCLSMGNHVTATCRNPSQANQLFLLQNQNKERIEIIELYVENEDSIRLCFEKLKEKNRPIDLLFNNAGVIDWSDLFEVSISSVEKIYKVNLIGCLMVLRLAIPCLQQSIAPLIINLSSRLGSIDLRGETQLGGAIAYQCSKAALNMLTKQAAIDLKPLKIRVISQSPGWVKTEMGGVEAKYQVSEAVSLMLNSLNQLPSDKTGIFIGEDGKEIPW